LVKKQKIISGTLHEDPSKFHSCWQHKFFIQAFFCNTQYLYFLQIHLAQKNTQYTLHSYANASRGYFMYIQPLFSHSAVPVYLILLSRHAPAQRKRSSLYQIWWWSLHLN